MAQRQFIKKRNSNCQRICIVHRFEDAETQSLSGLKQLLSSAEEFVLKHETESIGWNIRPIVELRRAF